MIRVLLDTNAMVYFFDKKTDIRAMLDRGLNTAYELYYADVSISELKRIKRNDVVRWLLSISVKKVSPVEAKGPVDDVLMDISRANEMHLLTFDKVLAQRALSAAIPIIRISGQNANIEK